MGQLKFEDPDITASNLPDSNIGTGVNVLRVPLISVDFVHECANADAGSDATPVSHDLPLDYGPVNVDDVQHLQSGTETVNNTVDSGSDSLPVKTMTKVDTADAASDTGQSNMDSMSPVESLSSDESLPAADPSNQHKQVNVTGLIPVVAEPIPELKTREQHMNTLILKNLAASESNNDSDTNADNPSEETEKSIHSMTTPWRFVFNKHVELQDEILNRYEEVTYPKGKLLGGRDGVMWAATLADFYRTEPWSDPQPGDSSTEAEPDKPSHPRSKKRKKTSSIVSSSMLYARYSPIATSEEQYRRIRLILKIAETEERPRIVPVYPIEKLIRRGESFVPEQEGGASWVRRSMTEPQSQKEAWELPANWPPESIFSPSASPSPWPLEPFKRLKNLVHVPTLQEYIPQHLLPEQLIVHDPWELLSGQVTEFHKDTTTPFKQKNDIIRVYHLHLSEDVRFAQDREELKTESANKKDTREKFLANPHSSMPMPEGMLYQPRQLSDTSNFGPSTPPVFVVFPPRPAKVAPQLAHLYISPAETLGTGNHSFVYRAEFEVPRSMLVEDIICEECVRADAKCILEEQDGLSGERRDSRWDETSGAYVLKLRGNAPRKVMFGSDSALCEWEDEIQSADVVYEGPYRAIKTTVGYQNLERAPYCEHLRRENVHPLTTKIQVAAKLSIKNDDHLPKEARNYQSFPKHFFEHRTGYNLAGLSGYDAPAPSGSVVPQFYGYYKEVWDDERNTDMKCNMQYFSPILLVEDCGTSIVPETMTVDERNECVSLILRMHAAGWIQNSLYRRNIVHQRGPLGEHPAIRRSKALPNRGDYGTQSSFRVIDFGRSSHRDAMDTDDYGYYLKYERKKLESWIQDGDLC